MSAETQRIQARFRYRGHRYNCDFRPGDNSVALLARLNAIRDFLRVQPEIQNEVFSVPDFEFVWHAASISVRDYPTSNGVINIESQRIKAPAFPAGNFRWHRSNIPRYQYFAEVFLFLRRRYSLITVPNVAEARQILSQPCDLHWKMCEYAAHPWFSLVLGPRLDFFAQTVELLQQTSCFQQQAWSTDAFHDLWQTIQEISGTHANQITLLRCYQDQRWRRTIPAHLLIVTAELLHYLATRPVMPLDKFLHCFDVCMQYPAEQWDFWCRSSAERLAVLATAAATTASEPTFYSTDVQPAPNSTARSRRLAESAQKWPSAIPASILLAHAKEYHEQFHQCLQPPRLCGICACPIWDMTFELLDFRAPPCDLAQLHPLLSGTLFLKEFANYATLDVPPAFRGLTLQRLQEFFVPAPIEVNPDASASYLPNLHMFLFSANNSSQQNRSVIRFLSCQICIYFLFFASQSSRREFSVITFASGRLAPAPCTRCSRNMENRNIRSNCLIAVPGMCPVCSVFPQSVAHLASICIGQQQSLSTSTRGTPVIVLWGTTFHCTRVCCPSAPHIDSFW